MSAGTVRGMKDDPTQMMVSVVQVQPEGHLNTRFPPEEFTQHEKNKRRNAQSCTGGARAAVFIVEAGRLFTQSPDPTRTGQESMQHCRRSRISMTGAFCA